MIYTFRFISDEEESFVIDTNINHDQTFEQLHDIIQEKLDFDPSQLASFFVSNEEWEKLNEITLMEMEGTQAKLMENTTIDQFFSKKNERILYIFDYISERLFFGSLIRLIDAESPIPLPSVSKLEGKIPAQTLHCNFGDEEFTMSELDQDAEHFGYEDELPEDLEDYNPEPGNDY
jgi:hypothetical protein